MAVNNKILEQEKIILSCKEIHCSEVTEDPTALNAKFVICSFDVNVNGVKLNRATIFDWLYTLVTQPVVAKIGISDSGDADFTSHNMHPVTRVGLDGAVYNDFEFDTTACGVFTSAQIEQINGKEFITAEAKIWKRFPEFCAIVKKRLISGTLNTSWEIETVESHIELLHGKKVKVIDRGRFLGHALLASHVQPAYPESQMLDVASADDESELLSALSKDISEISNTQKKEDVNVPNTKTQITEDGTVAATEVVQETTPATNEPNTSMLTEFDLQKALREAISVKLDKDKWDFYIIYHFPANGVVWVQMWDATSELDVITFTYTVENDVVQMSDPVDAKLTVSVAEINTTVAELTAKVAEQASALVQANRSIQELSVYKERFEIVEQEKIEAELSAKRDELKSYALKSNLISEDEINDDENIKTCISQLDKDKLNVIIAERFMSNQAKTGSANNEQNGVVVSTAAKLTQSPKANLETSDEVADHKTFIRAFIGA